MKIGGPTIILFTFLAVCCASTSQAKGSHPSEQLHFSAEDAAVEKPVVIPEDVLAILAKDELVRDVLDDEKLSAEKLPPSWFSASALHLSKPDEIDLVVVGNQPVSGGNTATFWVFRATTHGYQLVLTAPAHDLIVKRSRTMGYHDIEMLAATAINIHTVQFRSDGKTYKVSKEKWGPIK